MSQPKFRRRSFSLKGRTHLLIKKYLETDPKQQQTISGFVEELVLKGIPQDFQSIFQTKYFEVVEEEEDEKPPISTVSQDVDVLQSSSEKGSEQPEDKILDLYPLPQDFPQINTSSSSVHNIDCGDQSPQPQEICEPLAIPSSKEDIVQPDTIEPETILEPETIQPDTILVVPIVESLPVEESLGLREEVESTAPKRPAKKKKKKKVTPRVISSGDEMEGYIPPIIMF